MCIHRLMHEREKVGFRSKWRAKSKPLLGQVFFFGFGHWGGQEVRAPKVRKSKKLAPLYLTLTRRRLED